MLCWNKILELTLIFKIKMKLCFPNMNVKKIRVLSACSHFLKLIVICDRRNVERITLQNSYYLEGDLL